MRITNYIKGILLCGLLLPVQAFASTSGLQDAVDAISDGHYKSAYQQLISLARQGNIDAQVLVGVVYKEGQGTRLDIDKARFWFKRAAHKGRNDAAYLLGLSYLHDNATADEYKQAVYWIKYAARRDVYPAQRFMALAYEKGWMNMDVDVAKSQYWWDRYNNYKLAKNTAQ